MSDFQIALALTLAHEGGFFHKEKTGEIVNFGITAKFLESLGLPSTEADVKALTREQATELYKEYFWDKNKLGAITDQALANKVFDLAVNMGNFAVILLQRALNKETAFHYLKIDGSIGEATLARANTANPTVTLANLRTLAEERYRQIAAADPNHAGDLDGWLKRLAT